MVTRGGTPPLASGDVYTLTLTINGSSLTCSMTQTSGGAFSSSISMTDSNFSNGYHGFGQGKSGAADGEMRMDDFLIEQGS